MSHTLEPSVAVNGENVSVTSEPVLWAAVVPIALAHIGAAFALFYFTWPAVIACFVLTWITLHIGITLGFHRLLTHRSFATYRIVRLILATIGTIALQGKPTEWVGVHRQHHLFSDRDGDPHSPQRGLFWAHFGWLVRTPPSMKIAQEYTHDLNRDTELVWLDRLYLLPPTVVLVALYFFGGLPWLLWGGCMRLVLVWHFTWSVNSLAHVYGYQSNATAEQSRNNALVALLTFGEGWHNNHHRDPTCAAHGRSAWEVDLTYLVIVAMERVGLAWSVRHPGRT